MDALPRLWELCFRVLDDFKVRRSWRMGSMGRVCHPIPSPQEGGAGEWKAWGETITPQPPNSSSPGRRSWRTGSMGRVYHTPTPQLFLPREAELATGSMGRVYPTPTPLPVRRSWRMGSMGRVYHPDQRLVDNPVFPTHADAVRLVL